MEALRMSHSCTSCGATWQPQQVALGQGLRVPGRGGCSNGALPPTLPAPALPGPAAGGLCLGSNEALPPWCSQQSPYSPPSHEKAWEAVCAFL